MITRQWFDLPNDIYDHLLFSKLYIEWLQFEDDPFIVSGLIALISSPQGRYNVHFHPILPPSPSSTSLFSSPGPLLPSLDAHLQPVFRSGILGLKRPEIQRLMTLACCILKGVLITGLAASLKRGLISGLSAAVNDRSAGRSALVGQSFFGLQTS